MNTNEHKCWNRRRAAVMLAAVLGMVVPVWAAGDHGVDRPMRMDPALPAIPVVATFDPRLKGLWMRALERPEAEIRLQTLEAILVAKRQGMPDVAEFAAPAWKLLKDGGQDPAIHLAAAQALVALDAKDAAADLLAADRAGKLEMALVVDPALAKWKTAGAAEMWTSRVKDAGTADQMLRSALRSMGEIGAPDGAAAVAAILMDVKRSDATRLAAAEALALISPPDIAQTARPFASGKSMEERLLAAAMLPAGKHAAVTSLLMALAQDAEPGVAAIAVEKLMAGSPESLLPLDEKLAGSPDAVIRRHAVELLQRNADAAAVTALAKLLRDLVPHVREAAREALIELDANTGLRDAVRQAAEDELNKGNWQATEQAALVLGTLREAAAKNRLVELLRDKQAQVRVAAIVGLRRLHLAETLPEELRRAQELAQEYETKGGPRAKPRASLEELSQMDAELGQLNQNMGLAKMAEAEAYLQRFIPKNSYGDEGRTAAIWALGMLHDGEPAGNLARELTGRLTDNNPLQPESPHVQEMAAIGLARMKDAGAAGALTQIIGKGANPEIIEACEWGLAHLEGKPYAGPKAISSKREGWFLEPVE